MTTNSPSGALLQGFNAARLDLQAVLEAELHEGVRILDEVIKDAVRDIQARNKRLKEIEEFLAKAKRNMDEDKLPFPPSGLKFMKSMGISPKLEYARNVTLLQDAMDKLIAADEDAMKALEGLNAKRNQDVEALMAVVRRVAEERVAAVR